ncbi:hypothetical protein DFJ74DRAFT_701922 [Hyaloraphidium curvatum]|nr:hypothetical protein DFJ74DRAFT_701922 [Hyaloraphidium curvatum]
MERGTEAVPADGADLALDERDAARGGAEGAGGAASPRETDTESGLKRFAGHRDTLKRPARAAPHAETAADGAGGAAAADPADGAPADGGPRASLDSVEIGLRDDIRRMGLLSGGVLDAGVPLAASGDLVSEPEGTPDAAAPDDDDCSPAPAKGSARTASDELAMLLDGTSSPVPRQRCSSDASDSSASTLVEAGPSEPLLGIDEQMLSMEEPLLSMDSPIDAVESLLPPDSVFLESSLPDDAVLLDDPDRPAADQPDEQPAARSKAGRKVSFNSKVTLIHIDLMAKYGRADASDEEEEQAGKGRWGWLGRGLSRVVGAKPGGGPLSPTSPTSPGTPASPAASTFVSVAELRAAQQSKPAPAPPTLKIPASKAPGPSSPSSSSSVKSFGMIGSLISPFGSPKW